MEFPIPLNFTTIAILSSFFAAIANILARTLLKEIKAKEILAVNFFVMAGTLAFFSHTFYFFEISNTSLLLFASIVVIDAVANYFYFKSFEKSEASVVTPILSLLPIFALLFSIILQLETANPFQLIISILIVFGTVFFLFDFKNIKHFNRNTLVPALAAAVLFGLSAIPSKLLLTNLAATNPLTLYMYRAFFIGIINLFIFKLAFLAIKREHYKWIFFRGLFVIAQWALLYYALFKGSIGVSVTLANITPIFVFILGAIFLKEKPTVKRAVAAVMILIMSLIL